jgi:hypothetical protein
MTNQLLTRVSGEDVVRIHVDHETHKRLGAWTEADRFELRARDGSVTLDLRAPRLPKEINIELRLERAVVKLLLPEGAIVEHRDLEWSGRGRIKDAQRPNPTLSSTPTPAPTPTDSDASDGHTGPIRVRLHGTAQRSEIRVHRGGIAQLTALCSREFIEDALRARKSGTFPTVDDPSRTAMH